MVGVVRMTCANVTRPTPLGPCPSFGEKQLGWGGGEVGRWGGGRAAQNLFGGMQFVEDGGFSSIVQPKDKDANFFRTKQGTPSLGKQEAHACAAGLIMCR